MRLALIPGHGWRGPGRWDPGAVGLVEEAVVARAVAARVLALAPGRVSVHDAAGPAGPGHLYRERHAAALAALGQGPGVVVHLHLNSARTQGSYPLALHDPRSRRGQGLAAAWAAAVDAARRSSPSLRGLSPCQVRPAVRPAWDHAANLVEPTWSAPAQVSALVLELGFVGQQAHADLWTAAGVEALARSVLAL
jgi:hypothetical protein